MTDKALIITDIHYDSSYGSSLTVSCSLLQNPDDLGMYGNWLCDAPWELVISMVDAMKRIEPDPEFIIWNGYGQNV